MTRKSDPKTPALAPAPLVEEIRALIDSTRQRVASAVNAQLTVLYWQIGRRIHLHVVQKQRAAYGEEILATLSQELTAHYGRGFSYAALTRMLRFGELFPAEPMVATLSQQLSWSHVVDILPLKDALQREFYIQMCAAERWSVRTLRERITSMLYERTALSRQPQAQIEQELATLRDTQRMSPALLMRDPYVLDFLDLRDTWAESDLESAILREMESFLLELGAGFSFVSRQHRITLDGEDFHLDLLFYNRKLRRLVAVELKVGNFNAAHKGQMELYLRWLDRFEREPGEEPPLGIILCTGKKREQIELLELDKSGINVAEYLTALPPREVLTERLQQATARARQTLDQRLPPSASAAADSPDSDDD